MIDTEPNQEIRKIKQNHGSDNSNGKMDNLNIQDWTFAISGKILDVRDGTHDTPKYVDEKNFPLVTSKNLKKGCIDFSDVKHISNKDFVEINKRSKVDIGDVLFAMIGTIGNPVVVTKEPNYSIKNIGLFKNYLKIINSKLLKYFLESYTFLDQLEKRQLLKGTTQKFIPLGHLRNIEIPLAPLPIQRAIVQKIENLFASLDKGIADLKTAQEQLKVYRQAVLKKAFEGKLSGTVMQNAVYDKHDENENHEHHTNHSNQGSDNLPEGWKWVKLGEVCEKIEKVKRNENSEKESFIYLDIGGIDNSINKIVSHKSYNWKDAPSRAQQIVKLGDILFSTVRTYLKNIAKVDNIVYENQICSSGFTVVRGKKNILDSKYIYNYILSERFLQPINELQTGTSYPAVRDKDVFSQLVPLPPTLAEQHAIVREIESRLSVCDKVEQSISEALEKAEALRQSILKKAFEGRLLSRAEIARCKQEADYEPAAMLLDKIRKDRACPVSNKNTTNHDRQIPE